MDADTSSSESGHIGGIPVRNLWLLMLYASDLFQAKGSGSVGLDENLDDLPDLIAEILVHAVEARRRRHLSPGYQVRHAALSRMRGRVDMLTTERHQLLSRGLVACRFDELTVDTPRNRLVCAALHAIGGLVQRRDVARRCRSLAMSMRAAGVLGIVPTRAEMSTDRFGRHDADDQVMVAAAWLGLSLALPAETKGTNVLPLPGREIVWVRRLFEKAVGGFYGVVLGSQGWLVRCGRKQAWQIESRTSGIDRILPAMVTDVVLDHPAADLQIIIDTKFTDIVTAGWHREETLRSGYVYQMYAYLQSQVGKAGLQRSRVDGLLLHPSKGKALDETVRIQGHNIRFATVDLTASATSIRAQLLKVVDPQVLGD